MHFQNKMAAVAPSMTALATRVTPPATSFKQRALALATVFLQVYCLLPFALLQFLTNSSLTVSRHCFLLTGSTHFCVLVVFFPEVASIVTVTFYTLPKHIGSLYAVTTATVPAMISLFIAKLIKN